MIGEGQPRDEHPGQQLRQIADQQEGRPPVPPEQRLVTQHEQAQQPAPAEHRVQEGGDADPAPVGEILQIVQDGPDVQQPLIPAGGIGVRRATMPAW